MKTIKFIFILFFLLAVCPISQAQQTIFYNDLSREVQLGKELFNKKEYNAAYIQFEKISKKVNEKSEIYSEASFYKAISLMRTKQQDRGCELLDVFINEYVDSPYRNRALLYLADYHFDKKHYAVVKKTYEKIDNSSLNQEELMKLKFQKGYVNMMLDDNEKALVEFYDVKNTNNIYSKSATYYWAHIMYLDGNYQSALKGFKELENVSIYSRLIPLYVSHIYYKQKRYDEVIDYTVPIIDLVEEEHRIELSKIIGDSFFHLGEYKKAIPYLEKYYETAGAKTREDNYLLGYCYYVEQQYEKVVMLFENASKGKDEMAQNAYYHLADCYIKLNNKEKARVAFEAASELTFNEKIKEDALFSYAKLTYELSYSPFNETIKAFDKYISLYPNSERNADAYKYLTDVFMVTRNYKDAINSIEKIKVKSNDIKKAYQRVTFFRGVELFNNLAYNQAIEHFNLSIQNGDFDRSLNARAIFWKGEAQYRIADYKGSVETYTKFLKTVGAFSLPVFKDAEYNLAYAFFKMKEYAKSSYHFRNYIESMTGQNSGMLADAYNRLGDYYYAKAEYGQAIKNYQKALDIDIFDADYALYKIAACQGLKQKQQEKIYALERLQREYPESDYLDDALYEMGRANERLGKDRIAVDNYMSIINEFDESIYYPGAMLQLGLISYNRGDFDKALKYYKQVAERFKGGPEAQTALLGIKNCYVEKNDVDSYFAYISKMGGDNSVTTSEQDSLIYSNAERLYLSGNKNAVEQLRRYVAEFPDGAFSTNAKFYLAESLYKDKMYSEANVYYLHVAEQPNNIFSEQALSRASELTFNEKKYELALRLFEKLESVARGKWNLLKAYTGQMRCNFYLKHYPEAIVAAEKVKKLNVANKAWTMEADYTIGKSYYLAGEMRTALKALQLVSNDTKVEQGAEAKYLVAEIYFRNGQMKEAENEIMDYISKGTPFQFWLGKAFLLLTDVYHQRGDDFQAKHTLRSVVENYGNNSDGIKSEAEKRLSIIENTEKVNQQKAKQNSFQMKINEN